MLTKSDPFGPERVQMNLYIRHHCSRKYATTRHGYLVMDFHNKWLGLASLDGLSAFSILFEAFNQI